MIAIKVILGLTSFCAAFITIRNSSCGKVTFSQASVILSGGGLHARGCAWQGVCVCMAGGHAWRGCAWQGDMRGRKDGHCSGRYASYWNAFLFIIFIHYEVLSFPRKVITSHNFDFSAKALLC